MARLRRLTGATAAAAGIALSRMAGLFRAALVTNVLGVGRVGDAFAAALRIPNVIQNLLGEGALTAAFVPAYSSSVDEDDEAAGELAGAVASFLLILTAALVAIGVLAARPITRVIAWGFEGQRFELTVTLVRIITIGTGILVLTSWCLGVLNSHRRFFLSYVAPVIWNAVQIGVLITVVAAGWADVDVAEALAWGLVGGAVAQLAVQLPAVLRANPAIRLRAPWRNDAARVVIRRFGPAVLGRGAMQISAFVDLALASFLAVGAASAMAAAQTLYILPLSIIGISVMAAELPEISRLQDSTEIARRVERRLLTGTYLVTGVVALYLAAATPIADSVFNLGGFRDVIAHDDVMLIGLTLATYSLGLPALVASRLLQNVCFGVGDTSTPARIALIRITISFAIGVLLMFPLDKVLIVDGALTGFGGGDQFFDRLPSGVRTDELLPARLGALALAFGAAIGAWVELALLRGVVLARWGRARLLTAQRTRHAVIPIASLAAGWAVARATEIAEPLLDLVVIGAVVGVTHLAFGLALRSQAVEPLTSAMRRRESSSETPERPSTP